MHAAVQKREHSELSGVDADALLWWAMARRTEEEDRSHNCTSHEVTDEVFSKLV